MLQKHIQIKRVTSNKLECLPVRGNKGGKERRREKGKKEGIKGERGRQRNEGSMFKDPNIQCSKYIHSLQNDLWIQ